jgi:hypothetical protein
VNTLQNHLFYKYNPTHEENLKRIHLRTYKWHLHTACQLETQPKQFSAVHWLEKLKRTVLKLVAKFLIILNAIWSCGIRCADHMSTQYRLVQSGKTVSGGCSAGRGSSEPVAPRMYLFIYFYFINGSYMVHIPNIYNKLGNKNTY